MPWLPELFSAPVLQQFLDKRRRDKLVAVPYFDGLMAGDPGPLVESFAGEPEVHDPRRGRIEGVAPFTAFVTETSAWPLAAVRLYDDNHSATGSRGVDGPGIGK